MKNQPRRAASWMRRAWDRVGTCARTSPFLALLAIASTAWSPSSVAFPPAPVGEQFCRHGNCAPNPVTTNTISPEFNLRYPGMYFDKESGLYYNHFRNYSPERGRYVEPDPIGQDGGWNRFGYAEANPLSNADPLGLWSTDAHNYFIDEAFPGLTPELRSIIKEGSAYVDTPRFQDDMHTGLHGMTSRSMSEAQARQQMCEFIKSNLKRASAAKAKDDPRYLHYLGMALHPVMDLTSPAHRGWQMWRGGSDALKHGPWPTSLETLKIARQPQYRQETLDLMKRALSGDLSRCGCQ